MADLAEVTALLQTMAQAACYPAGLQGTTVTGNLNDIRVYEGWPVQTALEADMAASITNVSVFPLRVSAPAQAQYLDEVYTIVPPVYGLTATLAGSTVTLTGTPATGEFCTITADNRHSYSRGGTTAAAILSALIADVHVDYPGATLVGSTITFPTSRLVAALGAPGTLGKVTHRQKQGVMVSVWAATPATRNMVAAAIDVSFKAVNRLVFPDNSQGLMFQQSQEQIDARENISIYRRDMNFMVEYATLQQFTGYTITSINPTLDMGDPLSGSVATFNPSWG